MVLLAILIMILSLVILSLNMKINALIFFIYYDKQKEKPTRKQLKEFRKFLFECCND